MMLFHFLTLFFLLTFSYFLFFPFLYFLAISSFYTLLFLFLLYPHNHFSFLQSSHILFFFYYSISLSIFIILCSIVDFAVIVETFFFAYFGCGSCFVLICQDQYNSIQDVGVEPGSQPARGETNKQANNNQDPNVRGEPT